MHSEATTTQVESGGGAQSLYDRFARLYDLTFKFNRYAHSIERYLCARDLPLRRGARVLDAGCGTGLLTLSALRALEQPARVSAVDLSIKSLRAAARALRAEQHARRHEVCFGQANLLSLPFADETFDLVLTSGALEYVNVADGLRELARVVAPGGHLLHLPVVPSPATKLLEIMFRFKAHPMSDVEAATYPHFRLIDRHHFSPLEPIGWTKIALLSQKLEGAR